MPAAPSSPNAWSITTGREGIVIAVLDTGVYGSNNYIARKLLAGTSVDKIIPETPGEVIYSLNLKTARHMKTDIGDELVAGAAKVYE